MITKWILRNLMYSETKETDEKNDLNEKGR